MFPSNHKRYIIKTINIENGLQNNTVNDIVTDTFGFTWVATKTGLERYNGYRLESIQPVVNKQPFPIDYQVFFLQTSRHMIWMSCADGILQYDPFSGKFSRLIYFPSNEPSAIRPIEETKEGIWCASNKSLFLYSLAGKKITEVPFPKAFFNTFSIQSCRPAANKNYLFLIADGGRLISFDKQTFRFSPLLSDSIQVVNLAVTEDRLYILERQGISVYKMNKTTTTKINSFYQPNRFAGTIKIFGNGILANIDQHLLYLDSDCKHTNEIANLNGGSFLSVGFVKYIYQDKFNRLWILNSNDIRVILNYTVPFQYFAYKDAINFSKSIYADDEENRVLAGFYDGGIQLFDTLTNPLWKHPLRTDAVKDIAGIQKLGKNEYLITTIGRGWYVLDIKKQTYTPILVSSEDEARLNTTGIGWTNNIQKSDDNNILITTSGNVLRCHFLHNRILSADVLLRDENKNFFCSHYNKSDNCLWVGTGIGLVYGKHSDGTIDTIKTPGGYQVRTITTDAQNNIWIGTDKGLFVYTNTGRHLQTFTTANGLLNDCIYSMLTNKDRQIIYAGTNLGLSAICLNGVIRNYTKESGLQENEFNSAATASSPSGKLYFGGVNGVTAFYPSEVTVENDNPSLIVYKTEINDEAYETDSAAWSKTSYKLASNENKVAFSLTTFGIYQASDYNYEYRMEGFDKYWTKTNNPVTISYRLPPGTYYFKARLVNFPSQFISREIIIASPFWQRWWFYLLVFIFLVSLVWLTVRAIYQSRFKEQLQRLQIRQQVLAERERISRDLHDNIGAYASAISANVDEVIYQTKVPDPAIMQQLKDSAREIIVQLRDSIWALNKESQTVIMLSDRIKNYIQKLHPSYPDISFDVEEDVEQNASLPSITALHILRIVQEAVHNAVKHSGGTSILITISSHLPIIISIQDNGKGISASPAFGEGVKNMKARADDIGWQISIYNKTNGCTVQLTNIPS